MINFNSSETKVNLLRAFAGESQARNRYTFAASASKSANLQVISEVFTFTANQEKEHAKVFYNHLIKGGSGSLEIDAAYPVDAEKDILSILRSSQNNEFEEFENIYPIFGNIAADEGFEEIAKDFHMIAEIEKTHGNRFGIFAELIAEGKLFTCEVETGWMCLNCGHILKSTQAPLMCPVCQHNQGFFIRIS
ncbi:MAG: ferritin family protein, partial [Clostridiales bacterium]